MLFDRWQTFNSMTKREQENNGEYKISMWFHNKVLCDSYLAFKLFYPNKQKKNVRFWLELVWTCWQTDKYRMDWKYNKKKNAKWAKRKKKTRETTTVHKFCATMHVQYASLNVSVAWNFIYNGFVSNDMRRGICVVKIRYEMKETCIFEPIELEKCRWLKVYPNFFSFFSRSISLYLTLSRCILPCFALPRCIPLHPVFYRRFFSKLFKTTWFIWIFWSINCRRKIINGDFFNFFWIFPIQIQYFYDFTK